MVCDKILPVLREERVDGRHHPDGRGSRSGGGGDSHSRDHGGRDGGTESRHSDRRRDGAAAERRRSRSRGRTAKTIAFAIATLSAMARFTTAVAAAVVAVTAAPETTAVAMAAPRAAAVTAHATELPRNARARGRAGVTAKTIARAIAATWVAMARFTTAVAAAETANREIAAARHRTETKAFTTAP